MPKKRPRPLRAATGPCRDWGRVSQWASASTRTALAAAALAEPLGEAPPDRRAGLLGDLQQEGPERLAEDLQEVSREQPPQGSSPHADAATDQRYRRQRWNPGERKSAPHARDAPRRRPNFGHTPTSTAQLLSIGQAIGQVSWSTAVGLPAVAAESGQSGHRRLPPDSPEPPSLSAQAVGWQDASRWSVL